LAVVENYPTLQSIAAYKDLMTQLEGTENRISVERMNFNNTAKEFNIAVRRFPTNIIANILGFAQTSLFEAQDGADKAPEVKF
jgi:LemA protein